MPLNESSSQAGAEAGRRRLAGAFFIELSRIRPDPEQPRRRLDTDQQRELSDSIRQLGILQPITVRFLEAEKVYQVISGERRFHAATEAGLAEIPCWVQSPQAKDILLQQIVENWQRVDLQPFEIADSLHALRTANGYTQRQLADLVGKSEAEVSKLLSLLDLQADAQNLARDDTSGTLSRRHFLAATKLPPADQRAFLEHSREQALTAEDAEALAAQKAPSPRSTPKRGAPVTRVRFVTKEATVQFTFRRKSATPDMIVAALDQVRQQLLETPELRIIRAK